MWKLFALSECRNCLRYRFLRKECEEVCKFDHCFSQLMSCFSYVNNVQLNVKHRECHKNLAIENFSEVLKDILRTCYLRQRKAMLREVLLHVLLSLVNFFIYSLLIFIFFKKKLDKP